MKAISVLFMVLMPFLAFSEDCNVGNYQDFINKTGAHKCDLLRANLIGANLRGADLTEARVTAEQAEYLKSQGLSGFVIVE